MSAVVVDTPNGEINAVLELPSGTGPWPGVVLVHDALGLREPHREIARRIADQGYVTLLVDMFSRGGAARCVRSVFTDLYRREGRAFDDLTAARDTLTARADCTGSIGIVGFCMGGGFALAAAAKGFDAAAPFYPGSPAWQYKEIVDGACPIVASYGRRDVLNIGNAGRLRNALTATGVPHDVVEYPSAGHSFADEAPAPQFLAKIVGFGKDEAASEDAWRRVFAFFDLHLH